MKTLNDFPSFSIDDEGVKRIKAVCVLNDSDVFEIPILNVYIDFSKRESVFHIHEEFMDLFMEHKDFLDYIEIVTLKKGYILAEPFFIEIKTRMTGLNNVFNIRKNIFGTEFHKILNTKE